MSFHPSNFASNRELPSASPAMLDAAPAIHKPTALPWRPLWLGAPWNTYPRDPDGTAQAILHVAPGLHLLARFEDEPEDTASLSVAYEHPQHLAPVFNQPWAVHRVLGTSLQREEFERLVIAFLAGQGLTLNDSGYLACLGCSTVEPLKNSHRQSCRVAGSSAP